MRNAIGLIETVGLAGAIEAADAAVKSANVELIGMEYTKGDGMVVIKIEGDVGAVKAGIESARQSASRVCRVFSYKVIARPSNGLEMFLPKEPEVVHEVEAFEEEQLSEEIVKFDPEAEAEAVEQIEEADKDVEVEEQSEDVDPETEAVEQVKNVEQDAEVEDQPENVDFEAEEQVEEIVLEDETDETISLLDEKPKKWTCNLCRDPECTRTKGQVRRFCIHYFDKK